MPGVFAAANIRAASARLSGVVPNGDPSSRRQRHMLRCCWQRLPTRAPGRLEPRGVDNELWRSPLAGPFSLLDPVRRLPNRIAHGERA